MASPYEEMSMGEHEAAGASQEHDEGMGTGNGHDADLELDAEKERKRMKKERKEKKRKKREEEGGGGGDGSREEKKKKRKKRSNEEGDKEKSPERDRRREGDRVGGRRRSDGTPRSRSRSRDRRRRRSPSPRSRRPRSRSGSRSRGFRRAPGGGGGGGARRSRSRSRDRGFGGRDRGHGGGGGGGRGGGGGDRRRPRRSRSRSHSRSHSRSRSGSRTQQRKTGGSGGDTNDNNKSSLPPGVVDVIHEAMAGTPLPTLQEILKGNPTLGVMGAMQKIQQIKQLRAAGEQVLPHVQQMLRQRVAVARQTASAGDVASADVSLPARELFVGNLPVGVLVQQLVEFLGAALEQMKLTTQPGNPVVQPWLSPDGSFALVEFRSLEEANNALALNNLAVGGTNSKLRVGRPKEYQAIYEALAKGEGIPPAAEGEEEKEDGGATLVPAPATGVPAPLGTLVTSASSLSIGSTTASGAMAGAAASAGGAGAKVPSPFLMLMNIPAVLGEVDVKALLAPFGTLRSFNMLKDKEGTSKGIAIFEFDDRTQALLAVKGLANLDVGGKRLSIQEIPANQAAMLLRPATTAAPAGGAKTGEEGLSVVIRLENMLTADMDEEEVGEIKDEVTDECRKYGNVVSVLMAQAQGFIFVEFGGARASLRARTSLQGRSFDGRTIECVYYPHQAFQQRDLTAEPIVDEEEEKAEVEEAAAAAGAPAEGEEPGANGDGAKGQEEAEGAGAGEEEAEPSMVTSPTPAVVPQAVCEDLD